MPLLMALSFIACQPRDDSPKTAVIGSPQELTVKLTRMLELLPSNDASPPPNQGSLQQFIQEVLPDAQKVQSLLRDDTRNANLGTYYATELRPSALRELPWALKEAKRQGLSRIEISRVGPQAGSSNAHGDLALLEQLNQRDGLYTVRFHREGLDKGLRLSGWLFLEDKGWICLLKLGEEIKRRWTQ